MKLRNFYLQTVACNHKKALKSFGKSVLCAGMLLFGIPAFASPTSGLTFTGGPTNTISVCSSSGSNDINTVLSVDDPSVGDTLTWSENTAPMHGTLSVAYSDTTTGSTVVPMGMTYTPDMGYDGADTFMVDVTDGNITETVTIYVTVKPLPDVNATVDETVCNNSATIAVSFSGSLIGTSFDWTNDNTSVGLAATGIGDIASFTAMNSTTSATEAMVVVTPKLDGCSGAMDTFVITVNPTPTLSSDTTIGYICDNALFDYTAASAVSGTTFMWSRPSVFGIFGAGTSGSVSISESLDNTTVNPVAVTYTYTLTANGCTNSQFVTVTVNPTPTLFPTPLVGTICDGDTFSFLQNSQTPGVTYSWSRASVTGITNPDASGVDDINEMLFNSTPDPITVDYVDTLHINGCMTTETVSVVVNPTPKLSSSLTLSSICNNDTLDYGAASLTAGTTISWERMAIAGISSPYATGGDTVHEGHTNTTDTQMTVVYDFTLAANGCSNVQQVMVTVNPTPTLNTTLTPPAICDSNFFDYDPGSNTPGATYAWSRAAVTNITNPAASGTNNPSERLRSAASFTVAVTYQFTTTIDGCSNSESVVVVVNPRPKLTNSPVTPICDSTIFAFTPSCATVGFGAKWRRPYVSGIELLAGNDTFAVNEVLDNTTYANVNVAYIYTLTANGCSNEQTVNVLVHPTPELLPTALVDSACSDLPFVYNPDTKTNPAVSFEWSRTAVAGISPTSAADSGVINETLINSTTGTINVIYVYTLTVGASCTNVQSVNVAVRPAAAAPVIGIMPPSSLCEGTLYQNFGAESAPATGVTYTWSAENAEIYATGSDNQNSIVNFNTAGTAVITLSSTIGATGCVGKTSYTVDVNSSTAPMPAVIYRKGKFICLRNDVKDFQWGYDDAITLDSVVMDGETGQSYFNSTPDFSGKHYWVMVNSGDCMRKAYYNKPADNTPRVVSNINDDIASVNIFPNPATYSINVELTTEAVGDVHIEVLNMLGQVIANTNTVNNKADINVASLPSGIYIVECYMEGVKIGASKFVKK